MAESRSKSLDAGKAVLEALRPIDAKLADDLKAPAVAQALELAQTKDTEKVVAKQAHQAKVDEARAATKALTQLVSRVRAAVKGAYGPDSLEYQAVGGRRLSEHKKPSRKPKEG